MMTYSAPEFLIYPELASTNTELKKLVNQGNLSEHSIVITPHQTAGRGQVGNGWESELNKNLTFSLLLRPSFLAPHLQFYISKFVSLAIVDTIKQVAGLEACIKWPNDIYVGDKKVCGILIENSILGAQLDYCIAGIGLNINQEEFISGAPNPASLKQLTGKEYHIETTLELLLENIQQRYHELEVNRLDLINKEYFNALYRKNGIHPFNDENGAFNAHIDSINEMGLITLIDTEGGKREYAFKEVSFVV
ncbi:biotin--[acetyl-CoA-carboxylase] ligase [Carboxylicivirga sp. RSCT41]|uniref:biotin--[acetyl-CoA-carboxylase] ligase n=1 Tax=Carboxylicivirga agarovorans TaxID=3417570 RepID=UPI003D337E46